MIGKKYEIKGLKIEIVKDLGDKWGVDSSTNQDVDSIDKEVLDDAINISDAVEIAIVTP